jgi:hypothetical protein
MMLGSVMVMGDRDCVVKVFVVTVVAVVAAVVPVCFFITLSRTLSNS